MRRAFTVLFLFIPAIIFAQVPGTIIDPAIPAANPMDPNGDGFITSTGLAFTGPLDESEFEIPFLPIAEYQAEPVDDNQLLAGCVLYDLVSDPAQNAESSYYYFKDPDGIPDNGDELLFFRFRLARFSNGSTSYSILMDLDNKFGFSGPESDPNAVPGNPGFETEIAAYTSTGSDGGVRVFNVDGMDTATVIDQYYPLASHYQMAYALNQDPACSSRVPVFVDMYIPFSALGISSSTPFRMAVAVNDAIGSSLGGGASDIGGINGHLISNDDDQFIAAINNFSTIAMGNNTNRAPIGESATVSMNENLTNGTTVHTVSGADPDGDVLSYSIVAGNTGTAFAINSSSGAITVNNSASLDFETTSSFTLTVRVSDGSLFDGVTVTINLNDVNESPTAADATVSLNENTANGADVHTLVASDPDAGAVLSYSITSGNTATTFAINSSTGQITVNDFAAIDFESTPTFTLTVQVSDGSLTDDATVTITLIDINESPVNYDATVSLNENSGNGSLVHTMSASDPDAGAVLSYSITAGNTGDAFAINNNTGEIIVNNSAALDFESTPTFTLTVQVSDGSLTDDATVTINLNDINETPVVNDATVSLNENSGNGSLVHTMTASDPDAGAVLSYSIIAGNTGTAFAINSNTGKVTVNNSAALDFETTPTLTLTVQVSDGNFTDDAIVTINLNDVNEAVPTVNDATVSLNENSGNGSLVHTMTASDPDAGAVLSYSIIGGNTGTAFAINSSMGKITVNNSAALDFESTPTFTLTVQVSDGNFTDDATVIINLNDVNEIPAVNDATVSLNENSDNGSLVHTMTASDPDAGAVLSYSIIAGNTETAFSINSSTGEITVSNSAALDFESTPTFTLTVQVSDGSLTDDAAVTINLIDVDESPQKINPLKGFSPDGDGNNDFWLIQGIEAFPVNTVKVYNRWGNLVYEATNYNNSQIAWRGENNAQLLLGNANVMESTYYFMIQVEGAKPITGYLIVKK